MDHRKTPCARFILGGALFLSSVIACVGAEDPLEFFEKRIRPIFAEHCYECHSAESGKSKGGLLLDSREDILRGGDSGPAIVERDPERSKLVEAVRWKNQDFQMPPKRSLAGPQINDLETWVKIGAPHPIATAGEKKGKKKAPTVEEGRSFWSFRPLSAPKVPAFDERNQKWTESPIDGFILSSLIEKGLSPSVEADKRTLIRRATYDLTGLPPTPEEAEQFERNQSPAAFAELVEKLLQTDAYAEKWGRHWLDVARYADSNGLDENIAFGNAWRYRDYVIASFKKDKRFDQFLVEQIAGDLLPHATEDQRIEHLTATGFLGLGARVLAEPDLQKLEMDIIDEQIDTVGKAFMGMTLGCCRCHDHKFDPVPTADYYSLAAIFKSTRSIADEKLGAIKFSFEHSIATPEQLAAKKAHSTKVEEQRKKVTEAKNKAKNSLKQELHKSAAGYLSAAALLTDEPDYALVETLATEKNLRPRYLLHARLYLARHKLHPLFKQWHELKNSGGPERILSYFEPIFRCSLEAASAPKPKEEAATKIADEKVRLALDAINDPAGFLAIPDKDEHAFDQATLKTLAALADALAEAEKNEPDTPSIMGVQDREIVQTIPVHIRGSHLTLGKECGRGFPAVMRNSEVPPIFPSRQSGRMELARWMASAEHPLTARVYVNRVWRWHFGKGIVSSTDNFGLLGALPSHPELLDWLTRRFIEDGWSTKELHRLLMNSATYKQSSHTSPTAAAMDPDNHLLSRFNPRRLEAEEIRDSLLFVSGWLNQTRGGKTIALRNREFVFNHTSKDRTSYQNQRRTIYLPVIRNNVYDMMDLFDYPDPAVPSSDRATTTIAPQALLMLNSEMVFECSKRLSNELSSKDSQDDCSRINRAFLCTVCRLPNESEMKSLSYFLQKLRGALDQVKTDHKECEAQAWTLLCQTVLCSNEFAYIH
jgi:hypothetical protein